MRWRVAPRRKDGTSTTTNVSPKFINSLLRQARRSSRWAVVVVTSLPL